MALALRGGRSWLSTAGACTTFGLKAEIGRYPKRNPYKKCLVALVCVAVGLAVLLTASTELLQAAERSVPVGARLDVALLALTLELEVAGERPQEAPHPAPAGREGLCPEALGAAPAHR